MSEYKQELVDFVAFLKERAKTASKLTHYHQLEEWSKPTFGYIHDKLDHHGFVNGDPEANKDNKPVQLWWEVYKICSNICYSIHLDTIGSLHHSSAFERNAALIKEIELKFLLIDDC